MLRCALPHLCNQSCFLRFYVNSPPLAGYERHNCEKKQHFTPHRRMCAAIDSKQNLKTQRVLGTTSGGQRAARCAWALAPVGVLLAPSGLWWFPACRARGRARGPTANTRQQPTRFLDALLLLRACGPDMAVAVFGGCGMSGGMLWGVGVRKDNSRPLPKKARKRP
jgi:hypothetical protein